MASEKLDDYLALHHLEGSHSLSVITKNDFILLLTVRFLFVGSQTATAEEAAATAMQAKHVHLLQPASLSEDGQSNQ